MIKKAKFLAKEAALRIKYMTSKDCLFCKIIRGEIKTSSVYENDQLLAINDVNPVAPVHILIIPKKHIDRVETVSVEDSLEIMEMFKAAQKLVKEKNLEAYRLTFNGGKYQHVPHLHWHLLAGGKINWEKL